MAYWGNSQRVSVAAAESLSRGGARPDLHFKIPTLNTLEEQALGKGSKRRETSQETTAVKWERVCRGLDQSGKKWPDTGCIVMVEALGFADGL